MPASRPPINLDAVDPHNTPVPQFEGQHQPPTVLELLELAEREVRQARSLSWYGPASLARGGATLTGCVRFLTDHLDWITTTTDFGLEDFAETLHDCVRALSRFSSEHGDAGTVVLCPTILDDGTTCSHRLRVTVLREIEGRDDHRPTVWCRACGAVRAPDQLLAASGADDAYLPAAMLSEHLGVPERTIREWGSSGKVKRDGRRYRFGDVRDRVIARMARRQRGA